MDPEARLEELLLVTAELHGREVSTAFLATYKRVLLDALSAEEACGGVETCLGRRTYGFPKPWEIIEAVKGNPADMALAAWQTLLDAMQRHGPYKSMLFHDGRLTTVVEAMGGWIAVNGWLEKEMPIRRAEFMKLYEAARPAESKVLPGIVEGINAATGHLDHVPKPVVIPAPSKRAVPGEAAAPSGPREARLEVAGIPDELTEGMDRLLSRMSVPRE